MGARGVGARGVGARGVGASLLANPIIREQARSHGGPATGLLEGFGHLQHRVALAGTQIDSDEG